MNNSEKDFAATMESVFTTDWKLWDGLKGNWSIDALPGVLENYSSTRNEDLLGMGHVLTEYHTYKGHGSRGTSRVWVRNGEVLMVEVNYPQVGIDPSVIMEAWGAPEGEMGYFDGMIDFPQGAKAYPSKGMCLMLTTSQKHIVRALFFNPCSYDDYFGSLAPYMHSGNRIGNRY